MSEIKIQSGDFRRMLRAVEDLFAAKDQLEASLQEEKYRNETLVSENDRLKQELAASQTDRPKRVDRDIHDFVLTERDALRLGYDRLEVELRNTAFKATNLESQLVQAKASLAEKDAEIDRLKQEADANADLQGRLDECQDGLETTMEKNANWDIMYHGVLDENRRLKPEIERLIGRLHDLKSVVKTLQAENDRLKQEFETIKRERDVGQLINDSLVDKLKKLPPAADAEIAALKAENERLKDQLASAPEWVRVDVRLPEKDGYYYVRHSLADHTSYTFYRAQSPFECWIKVPPGGWCEWLDFKSKPAAVPPAKENT